MKLPADGGFGLLLDPTNGGFGIANIDMTGGGDVQMSADVLIGADAGAKVPREEQELSSKYLRLVALRIQLQFQVIILILKVYQERN